MLGFVFPVLPGLPFLAIGIVILGPHDPTLRRTAIGIRQILRRWSKAQQPHVRRAGIFARSRYRETRLALRAQLHNQLHCNQGWRGHLKLLAVTLISMAVSAGAMFAAWHTIP